MFPIDYRRPEVVAEIGCNHMGQLHVAVELIELARLCGVRHVKFQKRTVKELLSPEQYRAPHPNPHHSYGATYGEHRERLELGEAAWRELLALADSLQIDFFASPWDVPSAKLLSSLGCPMLKIPSAAATHTELLAEAASCGMPVILSTGMTTLEEIDQAVEILRDCELYLLQCTSDYPCTFDAVHLRVIPALRERYGRTVGLSGHHKGIAIDAAAVALGARVIERHFTLDRTWKGSDHAASLEPPGLARLVRDVRAVEQAMGRAHKEVQACEQASLAKLRGATMRKAA